MRLLKIVASAGLTTALTASLVGCGSDAGDAEATATTPTGSVDVAPRTLGVVSISRSSPAVLKTEEAITLAAKELGWEVKVIDANVEADKAAKAVDTFVTEKVEGIIGLTIEGALVSRGLLDARQAGIPTCEAGTVSPGDLWDAQYVDDNKVLGKELMDNITEAIPDARIADLHATNAAAGRDREEGVQESLAANANGAKIVANATPDLTDPVGGTQKAVTDMITAHPEINAIYAVYDNFAQGALSAVRNSRSDAKVFTYYGTPANVEALRSNEAMGAVLDADLATTGILCVDQILRHIENGTAIDPEALNKRGGLKHEIVTKDNVEEATGGGEVTFPNEDLLAPFLADWKQEFGER